MSKKNKMKKKMALSILSTPVIARALGKSLGVTPKKAQKMLINGIIKSRSTVDDDYGYKAPKFHVNSGSKRKGGIFGDFDSPAPKEDPLTGIINKMNRRRK